jgi:signal transduction histidine kinase
MWMLVMLWRMLGKVLRRFGWGLLLVPVAAMGIALFGLSVWTFGAVVLATVIAIQWPAAAARVLPPTMVGAGLSGLVVAGRISGSPVNWVVNRFTQVPVGKVPAFGALPPGGPHATRWFTIGGRPGGLQISYAPAAIGQAAASAKRQVLAKRAQVPGPGKPPPVPGPGRSVLLPAKLAPQRFYVKGPGPQRLTIMGKPAQQNFTIIGKGVAPGNRVSESVHGFTVMPGVFGKAVAARPPWAVQPPAGLWHGRLLVPVALLLLTLGLWLAPRTFAGLRGRGATLAPEVRRWLVQNRWGVLLVPVTLLGFTVFGVHPWTIAALVAAVVVLARWPRVAADLVPVMLAVFAVRGFELAANWQSMAAAFQGPAFGQPPMGPAVMYGAIQVDSPGTALLAGAEASAFLALGAWLVPRTIAAHARSVFTPGAELELAGRVQRLTESRSHAVDAATTELRRIERDLHDGAQARLVALGMNLRAVEKVLPVNPQAALALVAEARESSGRALSELRDLIRGICPPVLADRGLGHAVRALALDTPLPTELDIDLPGRLSPPVESAAYFAVAEALANAVKHSGARRVQIRIKHAADTLRIEVADDGIGGADPDRGTGLQGVERRLGTFDGILAVSSPPGGPTMIVMEVPCALSSPKTSSC